MRRYALTALFVSLAVTFAVALHGAASHRQQIASRLILATITDDAGRPIVDIDPDDIVVREGDELRDVLSIRLADYPIAIVIDNGRGPDRDFEAIRRATHRFIERVGVRPIAIAPVSPPRLLATFDDNRAKVVEQMDRLRKGGSSDGLFQAMITAARAIRETGAAFAALLVVVANPAGAVPTELQTSVLDSGATVHLVIQQKPSGRAKGAQRASVDALASLVDDTRGQLTTIYSPDSYQAALDRQANLLATELMVEYVVPAGSSRGEQVRIGVRLPGAKINVWGMSPR
jgi:hypothetical protein